MKRSLVSVLYYTDFNDSAIACDIWEWLRGGTEVTRQHQQQQDLSREKKRILCAVRVLQLQTSYETGGGGRFFSRPKPTFFLQTGKQAASVCLLFLALERLELRFGCWELPVPVAALPCCVPDIANFFTAPQFGFISITMMIDGGDDSDKRTVKYQQKTPPSAIQAKAENGGKGVH